MTIEIPPATPAEQAIEIYCGFGYGRRICDIQGFTTADLEWALDIKRYRNNFARSDDDYRRDAVMEGALYKTGLSRFLTYVRRNECARTPSIKSEHRHIAIALASMAVNRPDWIQELSRIKQIMSYEMLVWDNQDTYACSVAQILQSTFCDKEGSGCIDPRILQTYSTIYDAIR